MIKEVLRIKEVRRNGIQFGSWVGVRVSVPFRFMVLIVRGRTISVPPGACYRLYQDSSFPDPTSPKSSSPTAPDPVRQLPIQSDLVQNNRSRTTEQQIQNNRTSFLEPFMDLPRTFHGPSANLSWTFLKPFMDLSQSLRGPYSMWRGTDNIQ